MSSRSATFVGFIVILAAAVAWEVAAIVRPRFVTFGRVVRWLMGSTIFRVALFAFWAWAGWHLFARSTQA